MEETALICNLTLILDSGKPWTMTIPLDEAADLIDLMLCNNRANRWNEDYECHTMFIDTNKIAIAYIDNVRADNGDGE